MGAQLYDEMSDLYFFYNFSLGVYTTIRSTVWQD